MLGFFISDRAHLQVTVRNTNLETRKGPEKNPGGFRKFLLGLQKRVHEPKGKKREFSPEEFSEQLCRSRGADGRGLWEEE